MNFTLRLLMCIVLASVAGCGEETTRAPEPHSHHVHHAPHGGALQVLGDEYAHVELVLDAKEGRLTAYVLDGEVERAVRIAQPSLRISLSGLPGGDAVVELAPVGSPLTGETPGDTSQFETRSDTLRGVTEFRGVLETITARGVRFDGVGVAFPKGNDPHHEDDGR